ncbi:MAG: Dabb family protein [Bacteroidaceae bacterium]|nr:Dabb family protein [Bacteroidaceae bacterium]
MKKLLIILTASIIMVGCASKDSGRTQPVRHIILWTLNDSLEGGHKEDLIRTACEDFYSMRDRIPGVISMKAIYEGRLPSSNCDFMFDVVFESEDALKAFSENPEHLKRASVLRPFIKSRTCLDVLYQEQ